MRVIREGDRGQAVRDVQRRLLDLGLRIAADELEGRFGGSTHAAVRDFQRRRGLPADGMVGPDTWGQLVEAGYRLGDRTLYLRSPAFRGDDVRELQRSLNALGFDAGKEDGILGQRTATGVVEFQRNVGAKADGIVGLDTVRALERLRPSLDATSRAVVREAEAIRAMDATLAGSVVAIDAGHGPGDPGNEGPGGLTEAEVSFLLAGELAVALERRGASPVNLRDADANPTPSDRAQRANALEAAICVSIHTGGKDAGSEGTSCSYYGTPTTHSPAGHRLAECIQEELTVRLGRADAGIRPLAIAILRETRMPAVQVEPCVIANEKEEALLADGSFRRNVAEAIAEGIGRFFGAVDRERVEPLPR